MIMNDKWGKPFNTKTATVGKLKAMLTYIEGVIYRDHKQEEIADLISLLPDEYGIIVEELAMRKVKPYIAFHWVITLRYKNK